MKSRFLILSFFCLLLGSPYLSGASSVSYSIRAELDVGRNRVSGTETVVVTNPTKVPLREIHLFLYPNQFREKNSHLNEMNYLWHYPSGVDDGWLEVHSVRDGVSGASLQGESVHQAGLPDQTVFRIPLSQALEPGGEISLQIEFECKIPHKFGPFGHYRDTITAQGGWYPYLVPLSDSGQPLFGALPERSSFQVRLALSAKRDALINGEFFDDVSDIDLSAREAHYLSLVVAPQFYVHSRREETTTVFFYSLFPKRYKLERVMDSLDQVAREASSFFPGSTFERITLVETYLRAVMSFPGDHMILISDRFFLTDRMFDFRNLNILEASRAVGRSLAIDEVLRRENLVDYGWVAEAVAWAFRNEFLEDNFPKLSNLRDTAGSMGMFRPFNRMAASPVIPFSETYVGYVINRDPFRESLLYFNNDLPSGQLFAEKLRDTLGKEDFQKVVEGYLKQDKDFQSFVTEVAGQDMGWFFEQWKRGYPPDLDYRLTQVERNQKTDGGYLTRFTVEKNTSTELVDPVEVRVVKKGEEPALLLWDGRGARKTFELETTSKVESIEIDPRSRTAQTEVENDLSPRPWEMVMDRGDVDLSSGGLGAGMRIRMHRKRDRRKWMFVLPFFSTAELGVEAGMLFNPGGHVDGLIWNKKHEMAVSYIFTLLRSGFADAESGRVDGIGKSSGVKFRYTFRNKMFEEDPMNYQRFEFVTSLYRDELGGDFNFFQTSVRADGAIALHPRHKLAGIVALNYADGFRSQDEIPAQKLNDLSSYPFIGFAGSGRFLAENALGTSLEWRHDLMPSLDMNMMKNMRIRRVQGVLSFQVGWIAEDFDRLFRMNQAIFGVGYGLRFHYDFFGIRPSNFTFDLGYRLGDGDRDGDGTRLFFAFGILQSF